MVTYEKVTKASKIQWCLIENQQHPIYVVNNLEYYRSKVVVQDKCTTSPCPFKCHFRVGTGIMKGQN